MVTLSSLLPWFMTVRKDTHQPTSAVHQHSMNQSTYMQNLAFFFACLLTCLPLLLPLPPLPPLPPPLSWQEVVAAGRTMTGHSPSSAATIFSPGAGGQPPSSLALSLSLLFSIFTQPLFQTDGQSGLEEGSFFVFWAELHPVSFFQPALLLYPNKFFLSKRCLFRCCYSQNLALHFTHLTMQLGE